MLSEKGSLKETSPMKLLLTVFEQGLTGILYLKHDDVLKVLYFTRGKLIWAISNSEEDKLENILVAKNLVDLPNILKVKKESHVSESIGKLLVEKGLITLEELIETSKAQLKRIIYDVFKWKDGGFQFMKDAPPERLLSLDMSITDFIINYVIEELDVSEIWKTIGSLQIELIKNPNEEKLAKYHLSDRQMQMLNSFDGENKLEAILSRHSGGHRESLLKIIYFFLVSELLIKKEFELSDSSVFETGRDNYFEDADSHKEDKSHKVKGVEEEPFKSVSTFDTITKKVSKDYVFGEGEKVKEPESVTKSREENRVVFDYGDEDDNKDEDEEVQPDQLPKGFRKDQSPFFIEEKKKKRFINWVLLSVFLIFVIGGLILLLLPWLENESPLESMKNKEKKAADTIDIIKIEEKKPVVDAGKDVKQANEAVSGTVDNSTKNQANAAEVKPGNVTPAQDKEKDKPVNTEPQQPVGKTADSYFKEGNLITAGDVWNKELKKAGIKYSIMLELDCLKESVLHTYQRLEMKKEFFILIRREKSRICYLVMWGKFVTRQDAGEALKMVPNYFWKQKEPPEIVELSKYF
jgi:hypothetical protein